MKIFYVPHALKDEHPFLLYLLQINSVQESSAALVAVRLSREFKYYLDRLDIHSYVIVFLQIM